MAALSECLKKGPREFSLLLTFLFMTYVNWSDSELLSIALHYGEEARKWKWKFLGLLPEIHRRELYKKKGFTSLVYFAKVIGGVSEEQVARVLNLEKTFQNTPVLHSLLVAGEVSVNKMARVASIATPENEECLADQVRLLSSRALETYVKDARQEQSSVHVHKTEQIPETTQVSVQLDSAVAQRLQVLQDKGININELLTELLDQREQAIQSAKDLISQEASQKPTLSRYINARTRKLLTQEHGAKCSIPICTKPSTTIHHTQRFSISSTHNPYYLAPLCKQHHEIAHARDVRVQEVRQRCRQSGQRGG